MTITTKIRTLVRIYQYIIIELVCYNLNVSIVYISICVVFTHIIEGMNSQDKV